MAEARVTAAAFVLQVASLRFLFIRLLPCMHFPHTQMAVPADFVLSP